MSRATSLALLASSLNVPADWINNIISLESSWNPIAVSSMPYNEYSISQTPVIRPKYAKGLIQFTDETAQWLGFKDSQDIIDQFPDIDSQMAGPVLSYFNKYAPFDSEQSFYMAVFNPSYRYINPDTSTGQAVHASNPEISTIQDYITKAQAAGAAFAKALTDYSDSPALDIQAPIIVALVVVAFIILFK